MTSIMVAMSTTCAKKMCLKYFCDEFHFTLNKSSLSSYIVIGIQSALQSLRQLGNLRAAHLNIGWQFYWRKARTMNGGEGATQMGKRRMNLLGHRWLVGCFAKKKGFRLHLTYRI